MKAVRWSSSPMPRLLMYKGNSVTPARFWRSVGYLIAVKLLDILLNVFISDGFS